MKESIKNKIEYLNKKIINFEYKKLEKDTLFFDCLNLVCSYIIGMNAKGVALDVKEDIKQNILLKMIKRLKTNKQFEYETNITFYLVGCVKNELATLNSSKYFGTLETRSLSVLDLLNNEDNLLNFLNSDGDIQSIKNNTYDDVIDIINLNNNIKNLNKLLVKSLNEGIISYYKNKNLFLWVLALGVLRDTNQIFNFLPNRVRIDIKKIKQDLGSIKDILFK